MPNRDKTGPMGQGLGTGRGFGGCTDNTKNPRISRGRCGRGLGRGFGGGRRLDLGQNQSSPSNNDE